MTPAGTTPVRETRVSLRDVREATTRALIAHGASHGEAQTAAAMVLEAELADGSGLAALIEDLTREPWSRTPITTTTTTTRVASPPGREADRTTSLVLGSATVNRLLREAPLAVELIAGDPDPGVVAVPCSVASASLLDAVMIEVAVISGVDVVVLVCAAPGPVATRSTHDGTPSWGELRVAGPDGSVRISSLSAWPSAWRDVFDGPGIVAVRALDRPDELTGREVTAEDRVRVRVRAAEQGLSVQTEIWRQVYDASRRYLVPS